MRAWLLVGSAALSVVAGCGKSRSDDDDSASGNGGTAGGAAGSDVSKGGKAGTSGRAGTSAASGMSGASTGGSTAGASHVGGSSGGGSGGTEGGVGGGAGEPPTAGAGDASGVGDRGGSGNGGSSNGGSGGGGHAGTGGTAVSDMGPFACAGIEASCNRFVAFPTDTAASWGNGDFNGGISVTGSGLVRDAADESAIHITGTVSGYGAGFSLWFSSCFDLSAYDGISFELSGSAGASNALDFVLQTNSTEPWQARPQNHRGACTSATPSNPFADCVSPSIPLTLSDQVTTVLWDDVTGGKPTAWSSASSPGELTGLAWQFPWGSSATPYAVDISLRNLSLVSDAERVDCVPKQ